MESDFDAWLSGFPQRRLSGRAFRVVFRGYDRAEVDEYVRQAEGRLRRAGERIQRLDHELTVPAGQPAEHRRSGDSPEGGGEDSVVQRAEEQAADIVARAHSEASEIAADAEVDAAEMRAAAEEEMAAIRARVAAAARRADEANREAEQVRQEAKDAAARTLADGRNEAERMRTSARRDVEELTRQREAVAGQLRRICDLLGSMLAPGRGQHGRHSLEAAPWDVGGSGGRDRTDQARTLRAARVEPEAGAGGTLERSAGTNPPDEHRS